MQTSKGDKGGWRKEWIDTDDGDEGDDAEGIGGNVWTDEFPGGV